MIELLKSEERGREDLGWLKTKYSFSFASYYNPKKMGFRALRVINQDIVQENSGFPTHPHQNMEIITIILSGVIEHKDSMGNATKIQAGEVQRMSAGSGVRHSEYNPSETDPLELLQIWILPEKTGLKPDYEQKGFKPDDYRNKLKLIISPNGEEESLKINQNVKLYRTLLSAQTNLEYNIKKDRGIWLQLISGKLMVNDQALEKGDGLSVEDVAHLKLVAEAEADFLIFDLV